MRIRFKVKQSTALRLTKWLHRLLVFAFGAAAVEVHCQVCGGRFQTTPDKVGSVIAYHREFACPVAPGSSG